jgi:hypothetical protein
MGNAPKLKQKVRSLARRQTAMRLLAEGQPITLIAESLSVTTRTVRNLLTNALATESFFPSSLTPEKVAELRLLQAEVLANSRRMALETQATINARVGTAKEKSGDGQAVARLLEAVTRAIDLESNLFGTKQPTRIVEESMRLEVRKIDNKITISFDDKALQDDGRDVPGLHIGVAPALLAARALPENREADTTGGS